VNTPVNDGAAIATGVMDPELRSAIGRIARVPQLLVACDYDGTLAPIVEDPGKARPLPGAVPALGALAEQLGAVAIVTGRPAASAVDLGGFAGADRLGDLVILGHYGLERWDARMGEVRSADVGPGVDRARRELPDVLATAAAPPGTWIEDKGSSLAVHTRRTADPQAALARLGEPLRALAARHGLHPEPGRLVLELRPPGVDKGRALQSFVQERGGASAVAYAGDDLGDLAAYDALDRLRGRGVPGLAICAGSAEVSALRERADLVVDGPQGVVELLEALAAALSA
jgi:trehalose 6-phosphate phosphatase